MLDKESILSIIESFDERYNITNIDDEISDIAKIDILTFKCNGAFISFTLNKMKCKDIDIADLLNISIESISVNAFIDKEINGIPYHFRVSLLNNVTKLDRLVKILKSIHTINISRIDDTISKDSRNNKWIIHKYP